MILKILKKNEKEPSAEIEKKPVNEHVLSVADKAGWTVEEAHRAMKAARNEAGIKFKDYDRYNFHRIPPEEQKEKYEQILEEKRLNKEAIDTVVDLTSKDRAEVISDMKNARKTHKISYPEYAKYRLYRFPEEEIARAYRELLAEEEAVKARRRFIKKQLTRSKEAHEGQAVAGMTSPAAAERPFPAPVVAACWYLNDPLPRNASMEHQPSYYIRPLKGDLASLREMLGKKRLPDTERTNTEYQDFVDKYELMATLDHNETDLAVYYTDFLIHLKDRGFAAPDYFDFRLYEREMPERMEFLSDKGFMRYAKRVCITDLDLFKSKARFNKSFSEFVHRDWVDVNECTKDEFIAFIRKHPVAFAKPVDGTGGWDAYIVDSRGEDDLDSLYERLLEERDILEEVVAQHTDMAQMNPDSLNTIRVYSVVDVNDEPQIMGAIARFGRKGSAVDNFHQGGMCALVDISTGTLCTDALDNAGRYCASHPDSGIKFEGFRIPQWDKLISTVKRIALSCKDINRHAGWDVAINKDGEIEIIEANSTPNFDILQSIDQKPKREEYEKVLNPLAEAAGRKVYKPSGLDLDVNSMYAD